MPKKLLAPILTVLLVFVIALGWIAPAKASPWEGAIAQRSSQTSQQSSQTPKQTTRPHLPIRSPRTGSCDCPYDRDKAGHSCGKRSAYSRPGGASPRCYQDD